MAREDEGCPDRLGACFLPAVGGFSCGPSSSSAMAEGQSAARSKPNDGSERIELHPSLQHGQELLDVRFTSEADFAISHFSRASREGISGAGKRL